MKTKRLEDNLDLTWSLSFLHLIDSRDMKTNTWDPLDSSVIMLILASTSKRNANEIRMKSEWNPNGRRVTICKNFPFKDNLQRCLELQTHLWKRFYRLVFRSDIICSLFSDISSSIKRVKNTCRTYTSQECDQDRRDSDDNKKSKDASSIILHTQAGLSQRRFSPSV